jgi:hypothetical protein
MLPHSPSESPLELAPPSILVYTEFADLGPGEEWENTMKAINNTYGTDYQYTDLTNYSDLSTQLLGKDILLIPEQENADVTTMKTVGTAWSSTLTDFVTNGGVVVLLDFGNVSAPGLGLHIYNESGLMQMGPVMNQYPGGTIDILHRHTFGDALCRRIEYQPTPRNNTMVVNITDGTVAVDIYQHPSNDLHDPIVVHKTMSRGHVVFIGFDLSDPDANYENIVGNAIRLPNHVVFDAAQDTEYRWEFPPPNPDGYQGAAFVDDLVEAGFAVSRMDTFDSGLFNASDVVICTVPYYPTDDYNTAEIAELDTYVSNGGSIFIQSDCTSYGDDLRALANNFGYDWARDCLWDTDDAMQWYYESRIAYTGDNILSHPITTNVSRVEFYASDGFTTLPGNAERIIVSDWDGTTCWGGPWENWKAADGISPMAVSSYGSGKVCVVLDGNFMDGTPGINDADIDNDGELDYYDSDNDRLLINAVHWLADAVPANDAPLLSGLTHSPAIPTDGDPVTVYVNAVDADGLDNITCHYRDNYGAWQNVSMTPEGGDLYSAAIGNFYDTNDKEYYIRAFDSSADKMESVSSVVYLNGINYFPSTPGLQDPGTTDDDGVFLLNWTASSDPDGYIDHYDIQISDNSWFTNILDQVTAFTDERVITVFDNDTYYFRVRAVDDNGTEGFWCFPQWINVVIVEDLVGPAISALVLSPIAPVQGDSVTVSANITDPRDVKNATCYYRVNSGAWQPAGMFLGVGDEYGCDIGSFLVDDFIEYYVEAYDNSSNINMANTSIQSYQILNQPPSEPILIDPGTTISVSYLTLNWTAGNDLEGAIDHYQLQMSATDDFTLILGEWNVTGIDRELTGLSNGVYYFRVRTVDDHGAVSAWSNTESIEILAGTPTITTTTGTTTTLPFDPDILSLVLLIFSAGFVIIIVMIGASYLRQRSQKKYQF